MKETISVKSSKIKTSQRGNIMQSLSTIIRSSEPIPEVKIKSALINDDENIIAYWEESKQSKVQVKTFPITFGGSKGRCHPRKIVHFY